MKQRILMLIAALLAVASAPSLPAELVIEQRPTVVSVSGEVSSIAHEAILRQVALQLFPEHRHVFDTRVADDRDADWVRVTEATLRSLAHVRFATAVVDDERVRVRGVATDAGAWHTATATIRDTLPAGMLLNDEIRIVEADASDDRLCIAVLRAAVRDRPVTFESDLGDVKSSARPVLDEILQLASACPAVTIAIVGHSDAGERENTERPLGEARALAVRDYLIAGGISASRLTVESAGVSAPLVDGRGEFARSANRRVSFRFESP